jgi:hypothetical protein
MDRICLFDILTGYCGVCQVHVLTLTVWVNVGIYEESEQKGQMKLRQVREGNMGKVAARKPN